MSGFTGVSVGELNKLVETGGTVYGNVVFKASMFPLAAPPATVGEMRTAAALLVRGITHFYSSFSLYIDS